MAKNGKLTDHQKKLIAADYAEFQNYKEVGRLHNVSDTMVRNVVKANPETLELFAQKQEESITEVLRYIAGKTERKKKIIDLLFDRLDDKLSKDDMFVSVKDLATLYGIMVDKEYRPIEMQLRRDELSYKQKEIAVDYDKIRQAVEARNGQLYKPIEELPDRSIEDFEEELAEQNRTIGGAL